MKFSTLTLRVSVLFAGFTAAQDFSGLPKCAVSAFLQLTSTNVQRGSEQLVKLRKDLSICSDFMNLSDNM